MSDNELATIIAVSMMTLAAIAVIADAYKVKARQSEIPQKKPTYTFEKIARDASDRAYTKLARDREEESKKRNGGE